MEAFLATFGRAWEGQRVIVGVSIPDNSRRRGRRGGGAFFLEAAEDFLEEGLALDSPLTVDIFWQAWWWWWVIWWWSRRGKREKNLWVGTKGEERVTDYCQGGMNYR